MLKTRLTNLLGCQYPIVQTAMGWVSTPQLTASTSNAGGFGFLAGATILPKNVEREIVHTFELTNNNFGINFHMHQPNADEIVSLVIKYKIKAVSYSRSPNIRFIERLKEAGVICMPTVGLAKHAQQALKMGADIVTVQGCEGGGHTGKVPTSLLLPQVVDEVGNKIPVVAAGGFKDGRGLVAAMAWGADGIAMGTRFLMTKESPVPDKTKQRYIDCFDPSSIIVSTVIDGLPQRMLINETLMKIEKAKKIKRLLVAVINSVKFHYQTKNSLYQLLKTLVAMIQSKDVTLTQAIMAANAPMIIQKAMVDGDPERGILPSGQVASVIDQLLTCEEIINSIVIEAKERIRGLSAD